MVHTMCNVQVLLTQGVECLASTEVVAEESLTLEYIPVVLASIISGLMYTLSNTGPEGGIKSLIDSVGSFPASQIISWSQRNSRLYKWPMTTVSLLYDDRDYTSKFEGESVEDSSGESRLEQTVIDPNNLWQCAVGYNE